ncbi:hypothetical protein [Corallococcus sicarius]|uniref:hypothetical protein n=1 Tax=Corallococcus sicarius TaxID=2316726 RepID=UPI0011C483FA|nr:hypothetical protein [Corallococcus sicarius]
MARTPSPNPSDAEVADVFCYLKRHFEVKDVLPDELDYIYILESPHVYELIFRKPLSGASGENFSRQLTQGTHTVPFGLYHREEGNLPLPTALAKIGVMNICPFPLQSKPYGPGGSQLLAAMQDVLQALNVIRGSQNFDTVHISGWARKLKPMILTDFRDRLHGIPLSEPGSGSHPEQRQENRRVTSTTASGSASQTREMTSPSQDENHPPEPVKIRACGTFAEMFVNKLDDDGEIPRQLRIIRPRLDHPSLWTE